MKRPAFDGAAEKRSARLDAVGVGLIALRIISGAAVRAVAAGDRRRNHDAIADLQITHVRSDFLNNADAFVAEENSGGRDFKISLSHGLATSDELEPAGLPVTSQSLLELADGRMYEHKRSRRAGRIVRLRRQDCIHHIVPLAHVEQDHA